MPLLIMECVFLIYFLPKTGGRLKSHQKVCMIFMPLPQVCRD